MNTSKQTTLKKGEIMKLSIATQKTLYTAEVNAWKAFESALAEVTSEDMLNPSSEKEAALDKLHAAFEKAKARVLAFDAQLESLHLLKSLAV